MRKLKHERLRILAAGAILFLLVAALLKDVLFARDAVFLGSEREDMSHIFLQWMHLGAGCLREGSIALWNPYNFSGTPFFGSYQPALLYPLNVVLYTALPLHLAVNWSIALHIFLMGFFVYLWLYYRGLSHLSSGSIAVICMFSGLFYFRLHAGHLTVLTTAAWAPLFLLSIDGIDRELCPKWVLTGMLAASMMGLAGHPQYFFYILLSSSVYFFFLVIKGKDRLRKMFAAGSALAGGIMLSAVQWFTSLSEASESIRSAGMSYEFASSFSLPPESLITLLVPGFFGSPAVSPGHWGRSLAWEASLFMGVSGFLLMVYGIMFGEHRHKKFAGFTALIVFILALGSYTPLFPVLYKYAPGFNVLRGSAKLMLPASLFMALLMGAGFQAFYKARRLKPMIFVSGAAAVILFISAVSLQSSIELGSDFWPRVMNHVGRSGKTYAAPGAFTDEKMMAAAGMFAVRGLKISALFSLFFTVIISLRRKSRWVVHALAGLIALEMLMFAGGISPSFRPDGIYRQNGKIAAFMEERPGDYRILSSPMGSNAVMIPAFDIWGQHLSMLRRYAEFMNFVKGDEAPFRKADDAMMDHRFTGYNNFYRILRLRYIFRNGEMRVDFGDSLPRAYPVNDWEVVPDKTDLLRAIMDEAFAPDKRVLLESEPFSPGRAESKGAPENSVFEFTPLPRGGLRVEGAADDYIVLVITDSYSKNWRAASSEEAGREYRIIPAFYAVMGVPLEPGRHNFKLEYLPSGFIIGKWVSIISAVIFLAGAAYFRGRDGCKG